MIRVGQKLTIYVPEDKTDHYKRINNMSFSAKQAQAGKAAPVNQVATTRSEEEHKPQTTASSTAADNRQLASASSIEGDYEYYTVKKGDNLWTIARKYPGISNNDLMRLNNITDVKSLRAGQKLKIRPKT